MNGAPALPRRQRGVAVITALLLTTLAITVVASLFWQQQVQVRSIENQRTQLQKQWISRAALDWARLILREDARLSTTDNLDEPWAVPLAETPLGQYIEGGSTDALGSDAALSGYMIDAQSRYNLTNLCTNGTINPSEVAVFARLLAYLHLSPALAQETADVMASATVATANVASASSLPMNFAYSEDLLAVPGFSVEMLSILKDFVVVLPVATPVNVNTAPAEVLAARIELLSLADATAIVASRQQAYFRDTSDFIQRFPGKSLSAAMTNLSVSTNYFLVNGRVRLDRTTLDVVSLIDRTGGNPKVVWTREY